MNRSAPVANRTVTGKVRLDWSRTATGTAYLIEIRFPMSTRVLIAGMSPLLSRRRSSASIADRYWVGFTPKALKARRHADTDGVSEIGVAASRSRASACSARYFSASSPGLGPLLSPEAEMTPALIEGNRSLMAGS
jgi:hypothetical protein